MNLYEARSGPWPGATPSETVVNTALGSLCGQVYYRYANVFGSR